MSGTFQLSQPASSTMQLFPFDPLTKRWQAQRVATSGVGEPIFSAFWLVELGFESMASSDMSFFESRFVAGGLFTSVLAHPITAALVRFTGTAIEDVSYSFTDVERNSWVDSLTVTLKVNLRATG